MTENYSVSVVVGAKVAAIETIDEHELRVRLKSRPIGGKANEELVKSLAKHFRVAQSQVRIVRGLTSKRKLVTIELT